jgi:biotin carboxyl carrier protein
MIILKNNIWYCSFLILLIFFSCNNGKVADEKEVETKTPVTITNASMEPLAETIEMNAKSSFQINDNVKATLNGYIQEVHAILGEYVKKGQLLFTLKTKEASALAGRTGDTTLDFSGIVKIYSPLSGVITTLSKQSGDYVQDGDDLAMVAEQGSLVFILEVPYESKKYVKLGSSCNIILPGGDVLKGVISSEMPTVEEISQTQNFVLRPYSASALPENLIAKVEIEKSVKASAQTLPKDAVLTDETQSQWWVMKLINDSIAVKVPVEKGIESSGKIEILEPVFDTSDRIILTGNYGLPDTAKVLITKE